MHVLYALALLLVASAAHLVASLDQVNPVAAAAVADCSYPYQNYTCCVSACERPGGLPYACVAACAPVDCSVKGNCFNISGPHNFLPPIPKYGTDLARPGTTVGVPAFLGMRRQGGSAPL